jgi:hypothetical protein
VDDDDVRAARDPDHGREVVERMKLDRIEAGVDRITPRDDGERVAVGRRLDAEFVADRAARAGAVLDEDLLPERFRELPAHQPRDKIRAAPGRGRDDDADRPGGIRLRGGRASDAERQRRQNPAQR